MILRILIFAVLLPGAVWAQGAAGPCDTPEAAQFDFWIGRWHVEAGGKVVGYNDITRIQGGCTVFEQYHVPGGQYEGKSFNWFDPAGGRWHQMWVDSSGLRLHLEGGLVDDSMVMSGARSQGGAEIVDRITWTPRADGTVRQHWERSRDGGGIWQTAFDGLYRPAEDEAP